MNYEFLINHAAAIARFRITNAHVLHFRITNAEERVLINKKETFTTFLLKNRYSGLAWIANFVFL